MSQSRSSLTYFNVPNSLPDISSDSIFKISTSSLVILSFILSILLAIVSLLTCACDSCISKDFLFAVFALVMTCPVLESTDCVVVLFESPSLNLVISTSNVVFSLLSSDLISSNLFFFTSMFLTCFSLISSFAMFP